MSGRTSSGGGDEPLEALSDVDLSGLSSEEREEAEAIAKRIAFWSGRSEEAAGVEREALAELVDGDDADGDIGIEALADDLWRLSSDEWEEAEAMVERIKYWEGNEAVVDAEREALAELLGLDDASDVDLEVL